MNKSELIPQLDSKHLRLASLNESGYWYAFINSDGYRDAVWVTDVITA